MPLPLLLVSMFTGRCDDDTAGSVSDTAVYRSILTALVSVSVSASCHTKVSKHACYYTCREIDSQGSCER